MDEVDETFKKLKKGVESRDYRTVADTSAHLLKNPYAERRGLVPPQRGSVCLAAKGR